MNQSKKRTILDVVFLVVVFALTIYAVFHGQDPQKLMNNIRLADLRILLPLGIALVLIFIWFEALIFWYLFKAFDIRLKMGRCYLYAFIGYFFSCITPSASGGQPAQLVYMRKDKIPTAEATLVLLIDSIIYKLVLVVVGLGVFILRPPKIIAALEPVMFWMWIGMGLNIIGITFMVLFIFFPGVIHWMLELLLKILTKLPFIKIKKDIFQRLDRMMERYQKAARFILGHKWIIFKAFLMTILWRFAIFAVTALTYVAFHLHGTGLVSIMVLQCMISLAADMLPLPGGMGITERLFLQVFAPVFGGRLVLPAMVLSRGISYYAQLLLSAVMTIVAHFVIGRDERLNISAVKDRR